MRGGLRAYKRDDLYRLMTKLNFSLAACLHCMVLCIQLVISGLLFFFLSGLLDYYTLSRKKVIHRGFESTWGDNFYNNQHAEWKFDLREF